MHCITMHMSYDPSLLKIFVPETYMCIKIDLLVEMRQFGQESQITNAQWNFTIACYFEQFLEYHISLFHILILHIIASIVMLIVSIMLGIVFYHLCLALQPYSWNHRLVITTSKLTNGHELVCPSPPQSGTLYALSAATQSTSASWW